MEDLARTVLDYDNNTNRALPFTKRQELSEQLLTTIKLAITTGEENGLLPERSAVIYGLRVAGELYGPISSPKCPVGLAPWLISAAVQYNEAVDENRGDRGTHIRLIRVHYDDNLSQDLQIEN